MFKKTIQKTNVRRSDYLRAILSDTMPGDIPIIVSNDGTYTNLSNPANINLHIGEFATRLFAFNSKYTVPYRYNILQTGGRTRRLSLIHPSAQLDVARLYKDLGHLICFYARRSKASLRAPQKVGSLFYVKGPQAEKNALKRPDVDTVTLDKAVANPASYFAYRGHNRAHQFFASSDYLRLEKKYHAAITTDIAKCFGSIYTHTLYWAIVSVVAGKDNNHAYTFSNRFDHLMQSMNFNETNGICVGAEVSRIFAELILGEIDNRIIKLLRKPSAGICYGIEYEFFRYIDDYYIFAQDQKTAYRVLGAISSSLENFNLHLSQEKTFVLERPFITAKSRIIRDASLEMEAFFQKFLSSGYIEKQAYIFPKQIRRSASLLRSFLESIKSACFDHATGYESSSDYIVSAISDRVVDLTSTYKTVQREGKADLSLYPPALLLLLETAFYFYTVNPTVSSSHKLASSAILALRFVSENIAYQYQLLVQQISTWTNQLLQSLRNLPANDTAECVPLEVLNVLLVLGEFEAHDQTAQRNIQECCNRTEAAGYFEIVTYLHCIKGLPQHAQLRNTLFKRGKKLIDTKLGLRVDSESAHLALDLLACPYLKKEERASFFNVMRKSVGLSVLSKAESLIAVEACELTPWFVNWREADLLRLIRKKELNTVY